MTTRLRDDLMVVIPKALLDEREPGGGWWFAESEAFIGMLRVWRDTWKASEQARFPRWGAWLKTFETDPETVIVVPPTDGRPSINEKLGELRRSRATVRAQYAHRRAEQPEWHDFLNTFETVEPTEPAFQIDRGKLLHGRCRTKVEGMTRLERVAAGLEADVLSRSMDVEVHGSFINKAPAFSLRQPKPTLTIEPDPADGDDVCAPVTSDRYFGVKR